MITAALVMLVAIAPTAAQTDEPPPPESKVVDKPPAAQLPPLPLPEPKAERQPEPTAPDTSPPPEATGPKPSPEANPDLLPMMAPHLRLATAIGFAHDLTDRGTGGIVRLSASYAALMPILDPQLVVASFLDRPDGRGPGLVAGLGARVTPPRFWFLELGLDLAVLFDTQGQPHSQIGAVLHMQLARTLQVGLFVAHLSPSPAAAGIFTEGLELQIPLL